MLSSRPSRTPLPARRLESSLFVLINSTLNIELLCCFVFTLCARESFCTMLWHIRIEPAPFLPDSLGLRLAAQAVESGLPGPWSVSTSRGFLIEGEISREQLESAAARGARRSGRRGPSNRTMQRSG